MAIGKSRTFGKDLIWQIEIFAKLAWIKFGKLKVLLNLEWIYLGGKETFFLKNYAFRIYKQKKYLEQVTINMTRPT